MSIVEVQKRPMYESLVMSHSVDLGGNRAGVRFGEMRSPGSPTLFQEGTHGPADGLHRWMPSASMDKDGNIAIGYSVSSSSSFPSIAYVGRLASDPPGTLPQTETLMFAGAGSQTSPSRWGDYSSLGVDEVSPTVMDQTSLSLWLFTCQVTAKWPSR